mgnify:CR=1 FL=1
MTVFALMTANNKMEIQEKSDEINDDILRGKRPLIPETIGTQ